MSAIVALVFGLQKAVIQGLSVAALSVTQVLLPVAIISTVVVVRHVSPPNPVPPCQYRGVSMPSDGTLSFMQSFGCNLDNQCLPPNYTETPSEAMATNRFKRLDRALNPIVTNGTKMAKLKKLPQATDAIIKLGKSAAANNLTGMLDSLSMTVGSLFYNESLVINFLSVQTRLLTPEAARALMNGRLNLTSLISAFGGKTITDIVCDPSQLVQFLSMNYEGDRNLSIATQISSALCSVNSSKASSISDYLFSQFNIGKALDLFKQVATFTYNYNLTLAINDLQTFLRLMPEFETLRNLDTKAVSNWAVLLVQQLQKLITAPGLLTDAVYLTQTAEQVVELIGALFNNDANLKAQFEMAKKYIGSGQRLLNMMLQLQSLVLDSTLDKMLPPDVVKQLLSRGLTLSALQSTPVTLAGILQLLQVDQSTAPVVLSQLCGGAMDLRKLFSPPASNPNLLDQAQQFVCSNSTAVASLNLTRFLGDYFITAASLNMSQLVQDVMQLAQLSSNGSSAIIGQLMSIFADPSWSSAVKLNATQSPTASLALLASALDKAPLGAGDRSALLFVAHFLLLQAEALKLKATLSQEFVKFALTDPRVAAWVSTAATALPGVLVQQSLLTVPTHVYMFAYTQGLADSSEVQRLLCDQHSLQEMVDPATKAVLRNGGANAAKALNLFCSHSGVFVALCDVFKAKQIAVKARADQLMQLTNFSALPAIAETFTQWIQLDAEQRQLQVNASWYEQAVSELSVRVNASCALCETAAASYFSGMAIQDVVINMFAAYYMLDVANPLAFMSIRLPTESMVANLNSQTSGLIMANLWASVNRRDALLRALQTPHGANVLGLSLQLVMQSVQSPPLAIVLQQPKQPLCNGSYLTDYIPAVGAYPAGVKLNRSLCDFLAMSPDTAGLLEMTLKSWASMTANSTGSTNESLARALLMNMNQQQLLQYAFMTAPADSTLNFTLQASQIQLLSLAYQLFYNAATANASNPAVAEALLETNLQLNLQYRIYEFVWQFLSDLNKTRDLQSAALNAPELAELTASLPPAAKDLMRAALDGTLTVALPSSGAINMSSICVSFEPASLFGAAGSLASVKRFSTALCSTIRALPGSAMAKFGPLIQLFEPAGRAALSTAQFNVSAYWTLSDQVNQMIAELARLQITDILPGALNATDLNSFVNQYIADVNAMLSSNLTVLLEKFGQTLVQQLQTSPMIGPQVQQYMNTAVQLAAQLTNLLKASNYSVTGIVSGTEMDRLVALFNQAPGLLPTLLRTFYEAQANPAAASAAWTPVFANPALICANLTVFSQLLRTPDSVSPAALQADLCGAVQFNATALLAQMFQRLPAIKLLVDQLNCLTTGCTPASGNNTSTMELFGAMKSAAADFQELVTKIKFDGIRLEIFNSTYLPLLLAPELQRFAQLANGTLDAQLPAFLRSYGSLIINLMSSMNMSMGMHMDVMMKLLEWHQALFDVIIGGPTKLEALLNQTKDGQRLWNLLTSVPALTQVLMHTSSQHPDRITGLQTALISSSFNTSMAGSIFSSLCSLNFSNFLVVPPGVIFDPVAFQRDMCGLNLTTLETLPPPLSTLFSMTGSAAITPESLVKAMTTVSSANWSAVLPSWMPFLQQWSAALASSVSATPSVQLAFSQLDSMLTYLPADVLAPVRSVMSITNYLLDFTLSSVNRLLASNASSVADALYQLPETQKLLRLVSENFSDIVVAAAFNQRPMQYLLTLNQTEAFMYLCLSRNATLMAALGMKDFSFSSPPGVCVGCIVEQLCSVNIDSLMLEVQGFGNSLVGTWGSASAITFTALGNKSMQLQNLVVQLAAKSSVTVPGMFKSANWDAAISLLGPKFANATAISDNAQELLLTIYLSMKDPTAQAAFASILSNVLGQWGSRLEALLATKNLYEIFKGLPVVDALYNVTARDGGAATLQVLLDAALMNPKKMAELILNPTAAAGAFAQMCNGSMDLASVLGINATLDTRSVQLALCGILSDTGNVNALTSRLVDQLGLSSLFVAPGSLPAANLTAIQAQAQAFFRTLQALTSTSPTDLMPKLNLTVYAELISNSRLASFGAGTSAETKIYFAVYTALYTLLKTYVPAADFQRLQDTIEGSVLFLKAFAEYIGSAADGTGQLEISSLVKNLTSAEAILQQLLQPHNLTGLQVLTTKLPQLYSLVMANASSLCSSDLSEYFVLPASVNVKVLQASICRLSTDFQAEIMGNMDLMKLVQAVSGLTMPNKTMSFDSLYQLYSTLLRSTGLFSTVGNVTYRGVPVSSLLLMTPPELQSAFPDVITISGQMNLIFGIADAVSSNFELMIARDPMGATVLKVFHTTLATIQGILKSWGQSGELSLEAIFANATNWMELLSNTTVTAGDISALVNMTLRVDKLTALLSKPSEVASSICNSTDGFSAYFSVGASVPALDKVFRIVFCSPAAQEKLRTEFLNQMGITGVLSAISGNGTAVSLKDMVAQVRQLVDQVALVIQRPLVFNANGTIIDSLTKLLGSSDVITQLGRLLQAQFTQSASSFNFLPPILEAAYSLFKSSMPKETDQLNLGIAVAYEIIARTNAEVSGLLGKAITMETLLRPDNVLSPLLKSLDATDANTLTLLVQAVLNNTEFNRWLGMGFTNALCKEDLNKLFVSSLPVNLTRLQASVCSLTNSSALLSALGSMFNAKNSLVEMLTTLSVRQSVSVTNLYTMILELSASLQGVGSVNTSALDSKILAMLNALQPGSSGLLANYKAYLSGSLSAMTPLTLSPGDLALLGAVAGKLEQSAGLFSSVYRLLTGQGSPAAFIQALSSIAEDQRLAATLVLARGSQPKVAELCGNLKSVFSLATDASAVNASICQMPPDSWWQAKLSPAAAERMSVFLTGENATAVMLPWRALEPTLTSVISLGELLSSAPATAGNFSLTALMTTLQQLSVQQSLGPTLAMLITQPMSPADQATMQKVLEISTMFVSVLLTTHYDNLTNIVLQPAAMKQLMDAASSGYFMTEIQVLMSSPEYATLSGSDLKTVLCSYDKFDSALPGVRGGVAAQMILSPNDTRVDAQVKSAQSLLCDGAQRNMLMLQQLENVASLSKLVRVANSFKGMSAPQLMQELLSGNFSIASASRLLSDPNGFMNFISQLGQSLALSFNFSSPELISTMSAMQACTQLQSQTSALTLWNSGGSAVKLQHLLMAAVNSTDLVESALCDLAAVQLPSAASKLTQVMQRLINPGTSAGVADCGALVNFFKNTKVAACWSNQTSFVEMFAAKMQDYSTFLQLADQASQLQSVIGPEAASFLARIFNSVSSGVKNQVTIQSLLANSTSLTDFAKVLDVTKEMFNQIIGSTIMFNSSHIASLTDEALYSAICSPATISQIISFPPVLTVDMSTVSAGLCKQMMLSPQEKQRMLLLVRSATAPSFGGLDLSGWIRAITNFNNLMVQLNQLQAIRDLLSGFDLRRMSEYEAAILALIRSFPGQQIQQIGYSLVKDLQSMSIDPKLTADLNTFFASLRMFEFAKPLFPVKLQVKDFVDNTAAVTQYLQSQGIPAEISGLILNSYLFSEQLFNFSLKLSLPEALCNVGKLETLIDFSNVTYNVSSLVDQLCVNLTLRDIQNITETILRMGNFGNFFVKNLAQQLVNSLLNSSGLTVTDLKDAIQAVQETGSDLQNAFNVMDELAGVIAKYDPGSNIGSQNGLEGVSQAVCGTSGKFNFTSVYGISLSGGGSGGSSGGSGTGRRRRSTDSTNYYYELGALASNEFCRNLYDMTQQSTAGRIGWTYVKPIIRGRVIVTPDTNMTRFLMNGVQEQFTKIFNLKDLSSSLSGLLPTISGSAGGASVLSSLLSNPLASSAFSSVLGSSANLSSVQSLLGIFSSNQTSNSTSASQMLQLLQNFTSCIETNRLDFFAPDSSQYNSSVRSALSDNRLLAVVAFENLPARSRRDVSPGSSGLPGHVQYTIRMPYGTLYRTDALVSYPEIYEKRDSFLFDLAYQRGFVQVQEAIDRMIIRTQTGRDMPTQETKQMPSPCLISDSMLRSFGLAILPICSIFMWLAPLAIAMQQIMYDREHRLEIPLFLMGLRPSVHFLQWFAVQMLNMLLISAILAVACVYGGLLTGTDPSILFVLFGLFSFSVLGYGYLVSAFFTTSSVACAIALLVYLLMFIPFIFLSYLHLGGPGLHAVNVFSPTAFSLAARSIVTLQLANYKVVWADLLTDTYGMVIYGNFIALVLDGIVYFLIGWYVRNVLPGKHGVPQSPLFFLTARYWGCDSTRKKWDLARGTSAVVELKNVSKKFGSKHAVQDLNLKLREGETTILLGPNGAGKSTTINMMTGLITCDSGKVIVNGLNVATSFYKLRSCIGFCPQHNVYYEDLSVKRNLAYFGALKGCSKLDLQNMLRSLRLHKVRNVSVRHLSGGQKRRLSIGLAFLGRPGLVILDEPTAAVDPEARRTIWELIKEHRCTTLICTHDMQEAEILGDHVAVMKDGRIIDSRSYGDLSDACRYTVNISSESPRALAEELKAQNEDISEPAVNEHLKRVQLSCKKDGRAMATLTYGLDRMKNARQLITWFSITCSTVADYFNGLIFGKEVVQDSPQSIQYQKRIGKPSTCATVGALLTKRFHHAKRSWVSYIGMMLLPCLFIVFTMGSTLLRPSFSQESAKLLLTPTTYGPGAVTFLYQEAGFPMKEAVRSTLAQPPGLGTGCMAGPDKGKMLYFTTSCKDTTATWVKPNLTAAEQAKYDTYRNCSCDTQSHYTCADEYSKGTPPDVLATPSGDVIHELKETADLEDLLRRSSTRFNLSGPRPFSYAPAGNQRWGGLQLQANNSVIWFDNRGYHTLPAYLNAYSNTMLRAMVASSNYSNYSADYGITTYNYPLPMQRSQLNAESFETAIKDAGLAMCIVFALCFVPASISLTVSNERVSGERLHLRLYGVGITTYWITSFVWDMLMFMLPFGLVIGIMAAFQIDLYTANLNLAAIALLLALFGCSAIPLSYLMSRAMRSSAGGFLLSFFLLFFVGIVLFSLLLLLQFYVTFSNKEVTLQILTYVFMSLPSFSLGNGVYRVVENQWKASILKSYGADEYVNPFTMGMIGPHAIAMGVACVVFLIINILLDLRCRCGKRKVRFSYLSDGGSDVGVQEEFDRVNSGACSRDPIQLAGLSMNYRTVRGFRIQALDNLTLSVPAGTCLGLLGPNGSGKSTTFNILTGQLTDYQGQCSIEGLGYCPQSDPLDKEMTVTETLSFYARLLGLSSKDRESQLEQLIAALRLPPNKVAKALSGGQRRKLSVAIAFLGAPSCILMDEPSAGLDAVSRTALKQLVRCAVAQGSSVLFTSHCMDEVEGVCDRVAILIGGRLRAIGGMDDLKEQLGRSFTLTVRSARDGKEHLSKYLQNSFPTAECKMSAAGVSEFAVPITTKLHEIFNVMESVRGQLCTDYTVKQTTLEQVFLELCSHQSDSWREEGASGSGSDSPGTDSPPSSSAASAILTKQGGRGSPTDYFPDSERSGTLRSGGQESGSEKAYVYKVYL